QLPKDPVIHYGNKKHMMIKQNKDKQNQEIHHKIDELTALKEPTPQVICQFILVNSAEKIVGRIQEKQGNQIIVQTTFGSRVLCIRHIQQIKPLRFQS